MLATLLTALSFLVGAFRRLGTRLLRERPLPYLVYQPPPWQVQCVCQNRRGSRDCGKDGRSRRSSLGSGPAGRRASLSKEACEDPCERAALTIQTRYRLYQLHKQEKK